MVATPGPERAPIDDERCELALSSLTTEFLMPDIGSNLGVIDSCDGDASGSSRATDVCVET
jgi:hypothetical protein